MNTTMKAVDQIVDLLGLGEVLVGSLPPTLLTDQAPERYTVEAVFSRRPAREEIDAILSGETRAILSQKGYPTVEVTVSDRRLEIANTNLEELRDGLAGVLAERLAEISRQTQARRLLAAVRFQEFSDRESSRSAAVASLVGSVSFARHADGLSPQPDVATSRTTATTSADRVQLAEWADEGGAPAVVAS